MRTGPSIARHQSKQDYQTPMPFIRAVERRFGPLSCDLACSLENKKAPFGITEEQDSITVDWHKIGGNLWLNPPFANIGPWAKKCYEEARLGARILFLVPASVGSNWFRDYVHRRSFIHALNGRLEFMGPDQPAFPKDCILCQFSGSVTGDLLQGFTVWDWDEDDSDVI
jgi:phage N-6-adenine-methyltransferase